LDCTAPELAQETQAYVRIVTGRSAEDLDGRQVERIERDASRRSALSADRKAFYKAPLPNIGQPE
jgi:hypothetical protein